MPANLTPQYLEAEKEFKAAKEPEEKLEALEKMIRLLPKHKGTDHMLADLRRRRSVLKRELAKAKAKAKRGPSYRIPPEGGGQVVLLGAANCGKSSLLCRLSHATPEVAAFPYTTRDPIPGMMAYEDVAFQLIDTPAVTADFMVPWMVEISRNADAALLVADLSSDDTLEDVGTVRERLAAKKVELVGRLDRESMASPVRSLGTVLVGNKRDAPGAADRFEILGELLAGAFPMIAVSAETGEGLDELRLQVYTFLDVIRVYTKVPGKKEDQGEPFVLPRGSTILDFATTVHRDLADSLKFARLWGEGVYDGQPVKRDHVLHDGDIVELHR
jgi:small GTP-binding protein